MGLSSKVSTRSCTHPDARCQLRAEHIAVTRTAFATRTARGVVWAEGVQNSVPGQSGGSAWRP
eukprot:1376712-Rhodomonas_salina.1